MSQDEKLIVGKLYQISKENSRKLDELLLRLPPKWTKTHIIRNILYYKFITDLTENDKEYIRTFYKYPSDAISKIDHSLRHKLKRHACDVNRTMYEVMNDLIEETIKIFKRV